MSTTVYQPIINAVSNAKAISAGGAPGRTSDASPTATTNNANHAPSGNPSERNTAPRSAATSAPPPRASGYASEKSPWSYALTSA